MENTFEKTLVAEVKAQWKRLWQERIDDHVRAEGVAGADFDKLFVERGTVVSATRSFRVVTLQGILEQHKIANAQRFMPPNRHLGGWGKFVRTRLPRQSLRRGSTVSRELRKKQQLKKGGRGWLHT